MRKCAWNLARLYIHTYMHIRTYIYAHTHVHIEYIPHPAKKNIVRTQWRFIATPRRNAFIAHFQISLIFRCTFTHPVPLLHNKRYTNRLLCNGGVSPLLIFYRFPLPLLLTTRLLKTGFSLFAEEFIPPQG